VAFWNKFNASTTSTNQASSQSITASTEAGSESTETTAGFGFVPPSAVGGSGNVAFATIRNSIEDTKVIP
jgi:hypothetical protein